MLTKGPSEALKLIARMTPTSEPYKGMDSFFMVGVEPALKSEEDRTLTPTEHRDKEGKMKVSYQCKYFVVIFLYPFKTNVFGSIQESACPSVCPCSVHPKEKPSGIRFRLGYVYI